MKKSNFVALILGTVGCVFFALGMCMCLIQEWGVSRQGIVCGAAGLVVLLADLLIWRKMEGKPPSSSAPGRWAWWRWAWPALCSWGSACACRWSLASWWPALWWA